MHRHPFMQVIAITIVGTVIGTIVVLSVPWLPKQASSAAGEMDTLYEVLAVASVFIFSLVMGILTVSVLNFRRRFGDEGDGTPIHGNTRLEVLWTAIPAVIVTGAGIYSAVVLADIEHKLPNTKTIEVTAQQFAWTFDYNGQGIKHAGELHLVKGTPYLFNLHAKDVLHSFWVPEFRLKKDVVPGMTTNIRVKPTRIGTYSLVCAELCGLGHATMRARVVVEDQSAFDRWAAALRKTSAPAGGVGTTAGGA
jgi:cytochrome c oxidase subunit 2